jgi:hypothetical protein
MKVKFSWFQTFAVFWMLHAFFWVIPRRLKFICRRFGTLFYLHRQIGVEWLCLRAKSLTHTSLWPPCGSLHSTTCFVTGPTPTLLPSFLLTQAIFEPSLFPLWIPLHFLNTVSLHLSAYEDGTECSETSAYKIQTPGNYQEESIQQRPVYSRDVKAKWVGMFVSLYV